MPLTTTASFYGSEREQGSTRAKELFFGFINFLKTSNCAIDFFLKIEVTLARASNISKYRNHFHNPHTSCLARSSALSCWAHTILNHMGKQTNKHIQLVRVVCKQNNSHPVCPKNVLFLSCYLHPSLPHPLSSSSPLPVHRIAHTHSGD